MAKFREKIQSNTAAIKHRIVIVKEMIKGNRPADYDTAVRLLQEAEGLLDTNNDLIDLG